MMYLDFLSVHLKKYLFITQHIVQQNTIKYSKDKNKHSIQCKTQTEYLDCPFKCGLSADCKLNSIYCTVRMMQPIFSSGRSQDISLGARMKGRKSRPKLRAGWGSRGGQHAPFPPARESGERCELPSRVRGGAPTAQRFFTIFSTQDGLS